MSRVYEHRQVALKCALAAIAIFSALVVALAMVPTADAATPKAVTHVKVLKGKSFKKAKQGKVAGAAKDSAKAISAVKINVSGKTAGVKYTLYAKGKTFKNKKNGKVAGNGKKNGRAISVKLYGKLGKKYDVYYQAYVKGFGWTGWAKNGAKAGSASYDMTALRVKVTKKGAQPPTQEDAAAFLNSSNLFKEWAAAIARANGNDLKKALVWVFGKIGYASTGRPTMTKTSAFSASRVNAELKVAFEKRKGDCYTYTALGAEVAKALGNDARVAIGSYTSSKGAVQVYSWVVITVGSDEVIYDVTNNRLGIMPSDSLYAQFKEMK